MTKLRKSKFRKYIRTCIEEEKLDKGRKMGKEMKNGTNRILRVSSEI